MLFALPKKKQSLKLSTFQQRKLPWTSLWQVRRGVFTVLGVSLFLAQHMNPTPIVTWLKMFYLIWSAWCWCSGAWRRGIHLAETLIIPRSLWQNILQSLMRYENSICYSIRSQLNVMYQHVFNTINISSVVTVTGCQDIGWIQDSFSPTKFIYVLLQLW